MSSPMDAMNWPVVYPEILLLVMACLITLVDLWVSDPQRRVTLWLTQATLAAVGLMHLQAFDGGLTRYGMQGMMVTDPLSHLLAFFSAIAMMVCIAYVQAYLAARDMLKGEFFTLSLLSFLGISVMVAANNFLVVFLGLELMTLSLYALTAMRRDDREATEAAMKYFVLGALASGFLLYGLSMMYGATGSLDHGEVFKAIASGRINKGVLSFGIVFIVAGLAFKLGAVPFHMWLPDVYHGSPTAVTLLIAAAPKLAAFAIVIRLLVEAMIGLAVDWQQMLIVMAVASLLVGNLVAIVQRNLKRMLAYSTISQIGWVLLGLSVGVVNGSTLSAGNAYSSALFYLVSYVLTTLGTFGLIAYLSSQGFESEQIADFAGLSQRSPWAAGVMAIFMFSLAGLPPLVGFYAKVSVLQALVSTGMVLHLWLAVFAVLTSLIGAYYYIHVVKVMYFDVPSRRDSIVRSKGAGALLALNGAAVLYFGLLPGGLMNMCRDAIVKALAG
jgi:NADH-quinone oxidoreductase subunit N